jgi:glutamine amidotransferase
VERILAWTVNDRGASAPLLETFRLALDPLGPARSAARGAFGLGFHHQGEILVKKGPFSGPLDLVERLSRVPARTVVAAVNDDRAAAREIDRIQPLRYRNWLFAMSGTASLTQAFFDAASRHLAGFITPGRFVGTVAEAAMMVFMRAFHAVGELDHRGLSTHGIVQAIRNAVATFGRLAGDDPRPETAFVLHVEGHTFGVALGAPLHVAVRRAADAPHAPREIRHARAALVTSWDDPAVEARRTRVGPFGAVQVGRDAEPVPFDLRAA